MKTKDKFGYLSDHHSGHRRGRRIHTPFTPEWLPLFSNLVLVPGMAWIIRTITVDEAPTVGLVGVLGAGITFGLASITWRHFGSRNWELRIATTTTVGWMFGCGTVLSVVGPWHWPESFLWVAGGIVTGGYWPIRQWGRNLGKPGDEEGGTTSQVAALAGLAKAKVTHAQVDDRGSASARLALPRGETVSKELVGATEAIASLGDLPPSAVRIIPDPETPRKAILEIDGIDHLKTPRPWPGGSSVGGSIAEGVRAGFYGSGKEALLDLTGLLTGEVASHVLVTGMTGSGKTDSTVGGIVQEALTRRDVDIIVLDPMKALQSYGHLCDLIWLERDLTRCQKIMKTLSKVIADRTEKLGQSGFKDWNPDCGMKYLIVVLEEAYKIITDGRFDEVALAARSAGISLVSSVQRATWDSMSTLWRGQHAITWCHGVLNADDASYGLPDTMVGLVHPEVWRNKKPGYGYLAGGGIDDEDALRPLRGYRVDQNRKEIREYLISVRERLGLRLDLDPANEALRSLFESRPVWSPPMETTTEAVDEDQDHLDGELEEIDQLVKDDLLEAALEELGEMLPEEQEVVKDIQPAEDNHGEEVLFDEERLRELDPPGKPRLGSGAMRSAWVSWLGEHYREGDRRIRRIDAVQWAAQHGRSDSWVDDALKRLVKDGEARSSDWGEVELIREPEDPFTVFHNTE